LRSLPRRRGRAVFSLNNAAQVDVAQGSDLAHESVIDTTPRHFHETRPAVIDLMLPLPGLSPVSGKTVVNATVVCCGFVAGMFLSEDCPRNEYQATHTQIGRPRSNIRLSVLAAILTSYARRTSSRERMCPQTRQSGCRDCGARCHSPANWSANAFAGECDGVPLNDV